MIWLYSAGGTLVLGILAHVGWRLYRSACMTRNQRERREVLALIKPYFKPRRRDRPGQALRRAALAAKLAGKITARQLELFRAP